MTSNSFTYSKTQGLSDLRITFFPKPREGQTIAQAQTAFERLSQHNPAGFMPLGAYSYSHSVFAAERIGRYCSLGENITVMGQAHPTTWVTSSPLPYKPMRRRRLGIQGPAFPLEFDEAQKPVTIGHDVWIGQNVLLKGGINIGTGAVVASGAVVVKDVAPYTIVGGNPAKPIKPRLPADIANALLALDWWQYDYTGLQHLNFSSPETFLRDFPSAKDLTLLPEIRRTVFDHIAV